MQSLVVSTGKRKSMDGKMAKKKEKEKKQQKKRESFEIKCGKWYHEKLIVM